MPRPQHRTAHKPCPYGATNWTECDLAHSRRFGQCRALVDAKPEPHQCSRWAGDEEGWCTQHYASETERIRRSERAAAAKASLIARIDSHIAMTQKTPWFWLDGLTPSAESTRGLPPHSNPKIESHDQENGEQDAHADPNRGDGDSTQVGHDGTSFHPQPTPRARKGPYRLPEPG